MTTSQMKLFITAAGCLNFTEAAASLFITTSSLSRQIRSLEQELDLQLFIRNNRSVRLTPAGQALLEDVTQIYDSYCAAVERAQSIQKGFSATLRIGVLDGHLLDDQFPPLTAEMNRLYPQVQITLFHASFSGLCAALDDGRADLIITLDFALQNRTQFDSIVLSKTREYMIVAENSPLAARERITARDLSNETMITVSREDSLYAAARTEAARRETGLLLKSAPDLETMTLWIQAGIGFGIMNSHNILASDMNLRSIELEDVEVDAIEQTGAELVLAWHRFNTNPALANFLNICQDRMRVSRAPAPLNLRKRE